MKFLSGLQRLVGNEAQSGTAQVDSAARTRLHPRSAPRDRVADVECHCKAVAGAALRARNLRQSYSAFASAPHTLSIGAQPDLRTVTVVLVNVLWAGTTDE